MIDVEVWRPVVGYENLYEVSNIGNVRSLNYKNTGEIRNLKPCKNVHGYITVHLFKNGKRKTVDVHRLVAETFIENPKNLPQVNHKDEDKTNNFVNNLEWVSNRTNSNYGTRNKRISEKLSKSVLQYSLEGEFLKDWPSISEVKRELGFSQGNISRCCTGRLKTAYKYVWKYKNVSSS